MSSPLGTVKQLIRPLAAKFPISETEPVKNDTLVDIRKVPQDFLAKSDEKYTGFLRPALWSDKHLFNRKDIHGVALVSRDDPVELDDLRAWAVTRRYAGGIKIGPLYASDKESARAVLTAAMKLATPEAIKRIGMPNSAMNEWSIEKVTDEAKLAAEVWGGNQEAVELFEELGWVSAGYEYYRMWYDEKAPAAQDSGGASGKGAYAMFDAATG